MAIRFAYVTFPNQDTARQIGRQLVQERLIACINIMPMMESIFQWDGKIDSSKECAAILKTTAFKWEELVSRLETLHPYETPCIMGWDLAHGCRGFRDWVVAELSHQLS